MVASIYDTIFLSLWQEIFLDFSKNGESNIKSRGNQNDFSALFF